MTTSRWRGRKVRSLVGSTNRQQSQNPTSTLLSGRSSNTSLTRHHSMDQQSRARRMTNSLLPSSSSRSKPTLSCPSFSRRPTGRKNGLGKMQWSARSGNGKKAMREVSFIRGILPARDCWSMRCVRKVTLSQYLTPSLQIAPSVGRSWSSTLSFFNSYSTSLPPRPSNKPSLAGCPRLS